MLFRYHRLKLGQRYLEGEKDESKNNTTLKGKKMKLHVIMLTVLD